MYLFCFCYLFSCDGGVCGLFVLFVLLYYCLLWFGWGVWRWLLWVGIVDCVVAACWLLFKRLLCLFVLIALCLLFILLTSFGCCAYLWVLYRFCYACLDDCYSWFRFGLVDVCDFALFCLLFADGLLCFVISCWVVLLLFVAVALFSLVFDLLVCCLALFTVDVVCDLFCCSSYNGWVWLFVYSVLRLLII